MNGSLMGRELLRWRGSANEVWVGDYLLNKRGEGENYDFAMRPKKELY